MTGRAVHFSLSEAEVATLRELDCEGRIAHLFEVIEPDYFASHRDRMVESDKDWDAMHRSLTDGRLEWEGGAHPLGHVVLGGERLQEDDVIMVLKTADQVGDVAAALPAMTRETFRERYWAIDPTEYDGPFGETDFEATWETFEQVRTFFAHAAGERRFVLFTVSQ